MYSQSLLSPNLNTPTSFNNSSWQSFQTDSSWNYEALWFASDLLMMWHLELNLTCQLRSDQRGHYFPSRTLYFYELNPRCPFLATPTLPTVLQGSFIVNSSSLFTWITMSTILQVFFLILKQDLTFLPIKFSSVVSNYIFIPSSYSQWMLPSPKLMDSYPGLKTLALYSEMPNLPFYLVADWPCQLRKLLLILCG